MYSVLPAISSSYPHLKGRLPTCSSPVRHSRREASFSLAVRLACLRRAASVRSEPGSNSPLFYFKHPEGRLISIILSKSRFLFLGTLTFERKRNNSIRVIIHHSKHPFSPILCSTLIFLTKDFCSLAFSSFPSLYFQRPLRSKLLMFIAASEKYYIRISFFCQASFSFFFRFFFFISFEKEVNLMPKAISIKPFYFRAEAHL